MQAAMMMTFISILRVRFLACFLAKSQEPTKFVDLPVPHKQLDGLPWNNVSHLESPAILLAETHR